MFSITTRNGVDFHNRHVVYNGTYYQLNDDTKWGHAYQWAETARFVGIPIDMNPAVGAVAWFDAYAYGSAWTGHVAWVTAVNGDYVTLEEYRKPTAENGWTDYIYNTRTIHKSQVSGYIHIKDIGSSTPSQPITPSQPTAPEILNPGSDFYATIYYPHGDSYVEARGGDGSTYTNVQISSTPESMVYSKDPRQIWRFIRQSNGSYKIVNEWCGWCLDVAGGSAGKGKNVATWHDDHGDAPERWYAIQAPGSDIYYNLATALNYPQYVMDVDGWGTTPGTNVQLWTRESNDGAQQFNIIPQTYYQRPSAPDAPTNIRVNATSNGTVITWDAVPNPSIYDSRAYEVIVREFNLGTLTGVSSGQEYIHYTVYDPYCNSKVVLPDGAYTVRVRSLNTKYASSSSNYASGYSTSYFSVQPTTCKVSVSAATGTTGTGTVSGGGTYQKGDTVTVRATPSQGSRFGSWMGPDAAHDISTNPEYTFTVTKDTELIAYFYKETPQYSSIQVSASPSGTGTVSGGGTYQNGTSATVTATRSSGYRFVEWQENGVSASTENPYTFPVAGNRTLTAVFEEWPTYYVSTTANIAGGGSVSGGGFYLDGFLIQIVATPSSGYHFVEWQEDGKTVGTSATGWITVRSDRNLVAVFEQDDPDDPDTPDTPTTYTVSGIPSPTEGGTVTGGGDACQAGTSATLTATVNEGYQFKGWTENGQEIGTALSYTFDNISANHIVTAVFEKIEVPVYTVSVSATAGGTASGSGTYMKDASVTVTATPDTGYRFAGWSDGETTVTTTASYIFSATKNLALTAVFVEDGQGSEQAVRTIHVSATAGGTAFGGGTYPDGASVTVTATANSGYRFVGWQAGETVVSPKASYVFTVTTDQELTAVFEIMDESDPTLWYDVEFLQGTTAGGSVSGNGCYQAGTTITVLAEPDPGYQFARWIQDGNVVSTDASYTFEVNENKYLTAVFESKTCAITVNADPAEGGTVLGGGVCERGSSVTVTAMPNSGYRFVEWLANGVSVSSNASYTFTVNGDRTLTAKFSPNEGTPDMISVSVTKTSIRADSVFNDGSYGSLTANGNWDKWDGEDWDDLVSPQIALIDRSCIFKFPYRQDSDENYFTNGANFRYSDGIVSLTLGNAYYNGDLPLYYNLNGSPAFTLERTENEYTDDSGILHQESTSYLGGPMTDGYAVVIKKLYSFWSGSGVGGGSSDGENRTQIIDKNGTVTYELPPEYNETIQWGASGFTTKKSLGWCGEGLLAFFEHTSHEDWSVTTEGQGYMDPTGHMVIDLAGRGYTDLSSFHQGLAAVRDSRGSWGFIDKTGTEVIPCTYQACYSFGNDGLCAVKKDEKWGYIGRNGSVAIPFEYDNAFGAFDGLAAVAKDGKYGLVDYANNIVVPFEYDDISTYEGGVAYAVKDGIVYIISASAAPDTRIISVSASPSSGGTVTGSGSYQQGASVTVTASANTNYRFTRWTENGSEVSTDASYIFTVSADRALVAEFTYTGSSGTPSVPSYPSTPSYPDSSSNSTTYIPPTVLPVKTDKTNSGNGPVTETTASPTATVSGGKAVSIVSAAIATEIVKQATANNSESVVIAPEIKGAVIKTEVIIPASAVGKIGRDTSADLIVSTPVGTVTIPNGALTDLATGNNVTVAVEQTGNVAAFTIAADNQTVNVVPGGVTLSIPIASGTPGIVAVLVHADGTRQTIRKSIVSEGTLTVPLNGSAVLEIVDNAKTFIDVPGTSWAADAVAFASGHELFSGTGSDTFSPDSPMTRGMLAVVLHNLENNPGQAFSGAFSDVANSAWYAGAVTWAATQGIVGGYGNGLFGPGDSITREQLAVMLWRYAGEPAATDRELHFTDADTASGYALDALRWATEKNIINGKGGGILDPKGLATRAQVAQMLMNFLKK